MANLMEPADSYPSDWFTIESELSGLVLDVPYALKDPKTMVWMYNPNGTEGDCLIPWFDSTIRE